MKKKFAFFLNSTENVKDKKFVRYFNDYGTLYRTRRVKFRKLNILLKFSKPKLLNQN